MPDRFARKIPLGKFQTILEYMKSAASKQYNITIICSEHQNKCKAYIFTHDSKFINLFDI